MTKHCVFSYWLSRPVLPGAEAGAAAMAAYAKQVGADFRFARHDPFMDRYGVDPRWFDKLRPVFDPSFAQYEKVLTVDSDVFPVDGITANIFDEPVGDFGMVEEPDQPEFRERWPSSLFSTKGDKQWAGFVHGRWGCRPPLDAKGRPRTWNAGVILFTREGREKLRRVVPQPKDYEQTMRKFKMPGGVCTEQGLMNTWAFLPGIRFTEMSLEWNRQIHHTADGSIYDRRNGLTKFTHVMFRGADHRSAAWHHAIVNQKDRCQELLKSE